MEQTTALREAIAQAFKGTPYFSADSPRGASAELSGSHSVSFSTAMRTLQRPWTEEVTVASGDAYAVPVPGTSPVVVAGSRKIKLDRTYSYEAMEHTGKYSSLLLARVTLDEGAAPVDIHADQVRTETGYYHDAEFAPAGVSPARPDLTTPEHFFEVELKLAAMRLDEGLRRHWYDSSCDREAFTLEEAARSLYGAADHAPPAAQEALRAEFGPDVLRLKRVLPGPE